MRRRHALSVGLLLVPLAATPLAQLAPPAPPPEPPAPPMATGLEAIAPDDVFLYASFAGIDACSRAAEQLGLYRIWREGEVQSFVKDLLVEYEAIAEQTPDSVMEEWNLAKQMLGGRISLVLGDLTMVWTDDGPIPIPGAVLSLDVQGRRAEVEGFLDGVVLPELRATDAVEHWTETHGSIEVGVLQQSEHEPRLSVHYAFVDDQLLVGLNGHLLERCLANRHSGPSGTLGRSEAFLNARHAASGDTLIEVFVNVDELGRRVGGLLPVEVHEVFGALGLDAVRGVYYASAVQDGDSFDTLWIDAPGPHRGLLALDGEGSISAESLAFVPETAAHFTALRVDAAGAWDTVWGALEAVVPRRDLEEAREELADVEEDLGFSVRDGLLASLGRELIVYTELPANGFVPNVVLSMELSDGHGFARILGGLLTAGDVDIREIEYGEYSLYVIDVDDDDVPIAPTFTVTRDRLLASLSPSDLREAIDRVEGDLGRSVLGAANFQRASEGLAWQGADYLNYIDVPRLASFGYDIAETFLPGAVDPDDVPVDLFLMPSQDAIVPHLNGWLEVGRTEPNGFSWRARTLSLASVLAIAGRVIAEAPGAPPFVLGMATGEIDGRDFEVHEAPAWIPDVAEPEPAPVRIINPLSDDDPRIAEVRAELTAIEAAIEEEPAASGLHFERGLLSGQLGMHEQAIASYMRARELDPSGPATTPYNIACSYSLLGEKERALKWLAVALDEGFDSIAHLERDSDLDNIRGSAAFRQLLERHADATDARLVDAVPADPGPIEPPAPAEPEEASGGESSIVNPLAKGDPREAALRGEIAELTARIEQAPERGVLYFDRAIRLGQVREHERAIADYRRARELGYAEEVCAYNIACSHSLRGEVEAGLEWLGTSFDEGFERWSTVDRDSDLDALRADERFAKLVAEYRGAEQ